MSRYTFNFQLYVQIYTQFLVICLFLMVLFHFIMLQTWVLSFFHSCTLHTFIANFQFCNAIQRSNETFAVTYVRLQMKFLLMRFMYFGTQYFIYAYSASLKIYHQPSALVRGDGGGGGGRNERPEIVVEQGVAYKDE